MSTKNFVAADWPAPLNVKAYVTTRFDGYSLAPYHGFNLATHVGDQQDKVNLNRQLLQTLLNLPNEPIWLNQVHGTTCLIINQHSALNATADAAYSDQAGTVCSVLTADCLPILLCNTQGNEIAAIHAGWRGLVAGVITHTVNCFKSPPNQLLAWLGPAIGPEAFEVGSEVRSQFIEVDKALAQAFIPSTEGRWLANLYQLATQLLANLGIHRVYGKPRCTFSNPELFFSYRREPVTGRQASLIWFE